MSRTAIVIACAVAAGCQQAPAEQSASDTVNGYFAAVSSRSCDAMHLLSGGKVGADLDKLGCDGLLDGYKDVGLKLIAVNREVPDGRDKNARIVLATMAYAGRSPREVMLRVERARGRWVLVSI